MREVEAAKRILTRDEHMAIVWPGTCPTRAALTNWTHPRRVAALPDNSIFDRAARPSSSRKRAGRSILHWSSLAAGPGCAQRLLL